MASKRNTAEAYRAPALDMVTAKGLSKEDLLAALQDIAAQELIDTTGANTILRERASTRNNALQSSQVESKELSPEQINAYLAEFSGRFEDMPQLHRGIKWQEIESSLRADTESIKKLMKLDAANFKMNVFHSKNKAEIIFRMAQLDVSKIDLKYRIIMADKQAQIDYPEYKVNGNAEKIAESLGVEVADPELYEQLKLERGWVWLKTDAQTRESGHAFRGRDDGLCKAYPDVSYDLGSFCPALRVKKA